MEGTKNLGLGLLSGGTTSFTTSALPIGDNLPVGSLPITAVYGGDAEPLRQHIDDHQPGGCQGRLLHHVDFVDKPIQLSHDGPRSRRSSPGSTGARPAER